MSPVKLSDEYQTNPNLRKEDIQYLQEWLTKQPHLPAVPEELLILFLHACNYKLEAAKNTIENYFNVRTHAHEIFDNRDPSLPEIKQALSIMNVVALPKRDPRGNVVLLSRLSNDDPALFDHANLVKAYIMVKEMVLHQCGTVPGFVIVLDFQGMSLSHLTRCKLSVAKQYFTYVQDAFPGIVVSDHIINTVPATEKFLAMCRPFMKKELLDKLFLHSTMASFFEKVPKEIFPQDYGGDGEPMAEIYKTTLKDLDDHRDWFLKEQSMRVDESKRPGRAKSAGDIFGMEGSFKKLDID
ncbi:alpha-tocopherol transfer protein-like [Bacillus rossius redtenbacheri]|uniref:alpha-tocopherol transfer protein-like n=1 Tax=Bacillus rossius redtenbacheri TaxID=93214 RepID=UPI002FDCA916